MVESYMKEIIPYLEELWQGDTTCEAKSWGAI